MSRLPADSRSKRLSVELQESLREAASDDIEGRSLRRVISAFGEIGLAILLELEETHDRIDVLIANVRDRR